jgi:hypothetical protein
MQVTSNGYGRVLYGLSDSLTSDRYSISFQVLGNPFDFLLELPARTAVIDNVAVNLQIAKHKPCVLRVRTMRSDYSQKHSRPIPTRSTYLHIKVVSEPRCKGHIPTKFPFH